MSAAREIPDLVDVVDVVAELGLSDAQVRRLVDTGELVGYRFGRRVRIEHDSVRGYASRCRVHVPQPVPAPTSTAATNGGELRAGGGAFGRSLSRLWRAPGVTS